MAAPKPLHCENCASRPGGVFCDMHDASVAELDKLKTSNTYKRKQIVFYEGNMPFGLHCIYSGKVKVYKTGTEGREQIVRIAGPGDILGYRALFAGEPYSATAEALEDAMICFIDKNAFFPILAKNPATALNIIKKLSVELREAEDKVKDFAQKSARERMAELLLMLQTTYGKKMSKGQVIELLLSREEMADMIGTTQETAIRLLSEFKSDKIISMDGRQITVLDSQALQEIANLPV